MAQRKRELIEPTPGDKRYVRRDQGGRFDKVVDVGRSLAADRRSKSTTVARPGQGDKGDRTPAKSLVKKSSAGKSAAKKSAAKKSSSKGSTSSKAASSSKKKSSVKKSSAKASKKSR
ncbi:MAG TPA: hypothetical protein VHL58_19730 [Thermoanaerobaculia bacterium]|nr:hypothetical protein [Thermoanaerobaculia bacterium]